MINRSTLGRETRGVTTQFDTTGGFDEANSVFDNLNLGNVRSIETSFGPGRAGQLPDGSTVVVRPGSSPAPGSSVNGPPTLEIQQGRDRTKFRFGES
ncbi:hypothetical protein [Synechococcus sp. PCC 7336]|uniref:hypothetical protein n=1 Tax=Synechococcus sp. PCC 7336 TaxID=195250 RepID=UPI0012E9B391|nr:hypothetical protein [Synechococcus sp. PCC 7336]